MIYDKNKFRNYSDMHPAQTKIRPINGTDLRNISLYLVSTSTPSFVTAIVCSK